MACDITTIQTDACTSGIGKVQDPIALLQLIAQLTCEAAEAAGGGGGGALDMRAADYGGVAPLWVPTGTLGNAVDTVTEQVWWYYSGSWH